MCAVGDKVSGYDPGPKTTVDWSLHFVPAGSAHESIHACSGEWPTSSLRLYAIRPYMPLRAELKRRCGDHGYSAPQR